MNDVEWYICIIQEISGHRTLDELYKYLEVIPDRVRGAIANLSMLTPVEEQAYSVKPEYPPVSTSPNTQPIENNLN